MARSKAAIPSACGKTSHAFAVPTGYDTRMKEANKSVNKGAAAQADAPPAEMTIDELRPVLTREMLGDVIFDGWGWTAAESAAERLGVPKDRTRLVFPRGAIDMVLAFTRLADRTMADQLETEEVRAMNMRERIRRAVEIRLEQAAPHKEAVRTALQVLARPQHAFASARSLWRTCDTIWRAAGDTATDHNHYTKRMTLSGVYGATLLYWLQDESAAFAETRAFLDRRLDNVMQFEKAKAEFRKLNERRPRLTRFLGRLRYPGV